jgi:hypothetical protein
MFPTNCVVVFWQFCAIKTCTKSFMARFRQFTKRQFWQRFLVQTVPTRSRIIVEYNVFLFDEPLKAPNRLKSLKLACRFVLTSCDIYQNPFTQEKILKFWQYRTKNILLQYLVNIHLSCTQKCKNIPAAFLNPSTISGSNSSTDNS